jgi:hypothetical protein
MNNEPSTPIRGGYILFARRFIELLADMPLLDRTLWLWLYCKANHKDYAGGLVRGELVTTIDEIQTSMRYSVGYSFRKPSIHAVRRALERFSERNMIATRRTTRGLVITICEYDFYQNPANYECNASANVSAMTSAETSHSDKQECNKNEKKEEGGKPTNFSSKPSYLKTFDELARERADAAFERAARRFLADEQN